MQGPDPVFNQLYASVSGATGFAPEHLVFPADSLFPELNPTTLGAMTHQPLR